MARFIERIIEHEILFGVAGSDLTTILIALISVFNEVVLWLLVTFLFKIKRLQVAKRS